VSIAQKVFKVRGQRSEVMTWPINLYRRRNTFRQCCVDTYLLYSVSEKKRPKWFLGYLL